MLISPCISRFLPVFCVLFFVAISRAEVFSLDEYGSHVRNYLVSLENLAFDISTTDHTFDGRTTFQEECSVITIPGHFRVKTTGRARDKDGNETSQTTWELLRPDGYFVIWEKAEGQYVLKHMDPSVNSPLLLDPTPGFQELLNPVSSMGRPIIRFLGGGFGKTFFGNATAFRRHPNAFTLRVSNFINGGTSETEHELNERWLIRRSTISSEGRKLTCEITYTTYGDRLLPSRIKTQRFDPLGQSTTPGYLAEFKNYTDYEGTPRDFSLSQFGLPEPKGASSIYSSNSRWYLWLTGFAITALAVGAVLRWHVKRRAA